LPQVVEGDLGEPDTKAQFRRLVEEHGYTMRLLASTDVLKTKLTPRLACAATCGARAGAVSNAIEFDIMMFCLEETGCRSVDMHFAAARMYQ